MLTIVLTLEFNLFFFFLLWNLIMYTSFVFFLFLLLWKPYVHLCVFYPLFFENYISLVYFFHFETCEDAFELRARRFLPGQRCGGPSVGDFWVSDQYTSLSVHGHPPSGLWVLHELIRLWQKTPPEMPCGLKGLLFQWVRVRPFSLYLLAKFYFQCLLFLLRSRTIHLFVPVFHPRSVSTIEQMLFFK